MAYEFHKNKSAYFKQQYDNAIHYVVPFVMPYVSEKKQARVLEIGCAEGGVLKAFIDNGFSGTGIELLNGRYKKAQEYLAEDIQQDNAFLINRNIYDIDPEKDFTDKFDLIVLKDVIEHIHDQERLMAKMKDFLKPRGIIFFGFPPWLMPFGGHQQICTSKVSKLPFIHLLPKSLYQKLLMVNKESQTTIDELLEIKETQISTRQFETYSRNTNYTILKKQLFLVNPIYKYKFGLKPRKQFSLIAGIPLLNNIFSTAVFYIITAKEEL